MKKRQPARRSSRSAEPTPAAPAAPARGLYEVATVGGAGLIGRTADNVVAFTITVSPSLYGMRPTEINDVLRFLLTRLEAQS